MKKYLLAILYSSLLMAEELAVNKEVQGQNQKNYIEDSKVKDDKKDITTGNIKLIDIGVNPINLENKDKIIISYPSKENLKTDVNLSGKDLFNQKERESRAFFSIGGHDSLSNYKYGIIDNSELNLKYKEEDIVIPYNLMIKRENFEESRNNSRINSDYIKTTFNKDRFNLTVDLQKGEQEFPGLKNATSTVESDKEFTNFGTEFSYKFDDAIVLNTNYFYENNTSDSLSSTIYSRSFKSSYLELNGAKEFLYKDDKGNHSIDAKVGFAIDEGNNNKNNILYVEGKNRFNLINIPNTDFNAMAKIESGDGTNLSFNVLGSRKLDEETYLNAGFYMDSDYTPYKDIVKNSYVNDVVFKTDLENEKSYGFIGGMTYIKDKLYVNLDASINSSKNLISYKAVTVDAGKETAIVPVNYNKRVAHLDAKAKVSYTKDENLRGEGSLYLSTLKEVAYKPNFRAEAEGIYTKNKYEGRLKYNLNGSMYTQNKGSVGREYIKPFGTVDFTNTYSLSKDYLFNLNFSNLLDSKGEKMKDYPINGRMISLGVEIKY